MASHPSTATEFNKIVASNAIVVVDFYATWCGPCKAMSPIFTEAAKKHKSAKFVKVDVDSMPCVADKYGVTSLPTFALIVNGKLSKKITGASLPKFNQMIAGL